MKITLQEDWLLPNGKYQCPHCKKEYTKKGICTHIWRSHEDGQKHNPNIGFEDGSRKQWNSGLTKETSEGVSKMAKALEGKEPPKFSAEMKKIISEKIKEKYQTGELVGWNRLNIYRENEELGNKPALFYVCKFKHDDIEFIKVGITEKKSALDRYKVKSDTKHFEIETLIEIKMTNLEAAELENKTLNQFKEFKIKIPENLRFEGYTECLSLEVLNKFDW